MASVNLNPAPKSATINNDAEVTLEDQQLINRFARLDLKHDELDSKKSGLKLKLVNIDEAIEELMLTDDLDDDADNGQSAVNMRIGDFFVSTTNDEAQTMLEKQKVELQQEMEKLDSAIKKMKDEMSSIKAKLYAKFGNSINLDHK